MPNIQIKYASLCLEDDKRRLIGSNVEVIPRKIKPLWTHQDINGY